MTIRGESEQGLLLTIISSFMKGHNDKIRFQTRVMSFQERMEPDGKRL